MSLWPQFCSGTYQSRSPALDAELCQNLFPITVGSASNAKEKALLGTPGLKPVLSAASGPCRGLFSEDGRTFAVLGPTLYELTLATPTATSRGTIPDDGQPVSFASNGRGGEQLAIVGNGRLYLFDLDTNTFTGPITTPNTNAAVCTAFLDGYFFLLEVSTVRVWFSALEDGSSWDALDYFARSQTSDNYTGLAIVKDRIWAFGSATTDILYNSGDADTPFVPYPGAILDEGLVGPWAWATDGKALFWCAQNAQGRARFVTAIEGQVQAISTDAIDFALAKATNLTDVEALSYWQEGHQHVVWTVPCSTDCGRTFVWDHKEQLWHERGSYDAVLNVFYRWRVRGICSTASGLIVGDYATSDLYQLDLDTFTENGSIIKRIRRAPYLSAEATIGFLDQFELGIQPGIGLTQGQGSDPQIMLRVSRDGSNTWTPYVIGRMGKIGEYNSRCIFRRLGRARLDRLVIEVSITDSVRCVLGPGAWLRITSGSGQL